MALYWLSSTHVRRAKEIYDNSPRKTDQKDAAVIAMLIQMGRSQRLLLPRGEFAELRIYGKFREQKLVELGVQRNILHSQIDTIFPEYGGFFSKFECKTSLYLLERYTTPERMCKLGLVRLTAAIRKASRGRFNDRHAREVLIAAESTIGVREGAEAFAMAIRETVRSIRRILHEIECIESRLKNSEQNRICRASAFHPGYRSGHLGYNPWRNRGSAPLSKSRGSNQACWLESL
jgi:transposase